MIPIELTLNSYIKAAEAFNAAPQSRRVHHAVSGLISEIGELARVINKDDRVEGGIDPDVYEHGIMDELGDIAWFIAEICNINDIADVVSAPAMVMNTNVHEALVNMNFSSATVTSAMISPFRRNVSEPVVGMVHLADMLWTYWFTMCILHGIDPTTCLRNNLAKLEERVRVNIIVNNSLDGRAS